MSRPWRSLWKNVHVLNLNRSSFPDSSSFYNFVENVLSLRNPDLNLRKITYNNKGGYWYEDSSTTIDLVFKYAVSNSDEFSMDCTFRYDYSKMYGLITTNSNLKNLTLRSWALSQEGSSPAFQSLTSLALYHC
ncbi:hypothetical protein LINPERPRIM_LOCUS28635 [Linum perenne]